MRRRSFLRTSAAATLATLPLAGCAALSGGGVDEEALAEAQADIEENEQTFENASAAFERGERPDFDAEQVRSVASRADETLADLEGDASGDQAAAIGALRSWTDFQQRRADVLEQVIRMQAQLDIVSNHLGGDNVEEARSAITDARSIYDDLDPAVDEMAAAYEDVDREALAEDGFEVSHEEITTFIEDLRSYLDVLNAMFAGIGSLLDGFVAYQDATAAFEAEEFDGAADQFDGAQSDFETAETDFEGLDGSSTDIETIDSGASELRCVAGAFAESSGLMRDSAEAAAAGEFERATDLSEQAVQTAEQCDV